MTFTAFTEGSSHVNWRKVAQTLTWWFLGFFCVLFATYALVAQGKLNVAFVRKYYRVVNFTVLDKEENGNYTFSIMLDNEAPGNIPTVIRCIPFLPLLS